MVPKYAKLGFLSILAALVILCPIASQAQDDMGKNHSVTGCLQKGVEGGGFYIVSDDTMWELGGKISAKHVGHKVTVTGHVEHKAKVKEAKFEDSEKKEAEGKSVTDFEVTGLKMVSESCQ
jgi:hypothetical protein